MDDDLRKLEEILRKLRSLSKNTASGGMNIAQFVTTKIKRQLENVEEREKAAAKQVQTWFDNAKVNKAGYSHHG